MIFWQEATKDPSLANPDGVLHKIDALCPHRLVGYGGYAGGGRSELLGQCGPAGCSGKLQASVLHMGPIQGCYGATVRAGYKVEEA